MTAPKLVEHFFRHEYARLVAVMARRSGVQHITAIEDAVQANVYKRLSRARSRLRALGLSTDDLTEEQMTSRLPGVNKVIYALFAEGYLSSGAEFAIRRDLCEEAIRLATILADHPVGNSPEVFALLALMHLHAARMTAREDGSGGLLLLEEQDRSLWDGHQIELGLQVVGVVRPRGSSLSLSCRGWRCRGTLPCPLVSGDTLGPGGGLLRTARTRRSLGNQPPQPGRRGSGVAWTCRRACRAQAFRTAIMARWVLPLVCGPCRSASPLRAPGRSQALWR